MDRSTHRSLSQPQLGGACQYGCVCVYCWQYYSRGIKPSLRYYRHTGRQTGRRERKTGSFELDTAVGLKLLPLFFFSPTEQRWFRSSVAASERPQPGQPLQRAPAAWRTGDKLQAGTRRPVRAQGRQTNKQPPWHSPAACLFLISTVLLLAELLSVWLSVRLSAGRFRKPSPARHNTGLPPSLSPVCMSRANPVRPGQSFDYTMEGTEKRTTEEKRNERNGWKEAVLTVIQPSAPLLSLSRSHSPYMSLYQSRSLLLPLLDDVKLDATNTIASCSFFRNKTVK